MVRPRLYPDGACYPLTLSLPEPVAHQIIEAARQRGQSPGQLLTPYLRDILGSLTTDAPAKDFDHG